MSLSDKIEDFNDDRYSKSIKVEDVKEFIRLLKEEFSPQNNSRKFSQEEIKERIDKLAGDELL